MANNTCIFCGQKPSMFQDTIVICGNTHQNACKTCEKELKGLDELEICRRALIRNLAENPEKIRARMELITEAEDHRPKCLQCEGKLTFMDVQSLDNSPMNDTIFTGTFDILPAYCKACGKFEFYNPAIIRKNKHLTYLQLKDTQN